jgi:homoisocitrate dehydrogenase
MTAKDKTICLIPGDGVGKEVIPVAAELLAALGLGLRFVETSAGFEHFQACGEAIPDETLSEVESAGVALFGATASPSYPVSGYRSPILIMRKAFDLYANLRPVFSLPGSFSRPGIHLLLVRENTEGLYAGRERMDGDTAIAERVITRRACERIARVAFEAARQRETKSGLTRALNEVFALPDRPVPKVTLVHKANVLKLSDGLFRQVCLETAVAYAGVDVQEMLVDAAAMHLVRAPEQFDILVTTNLFGDILSDEASGLVGGLGVAPSANLGPSVAVFEPVHGSAPDIAGQGNANPLGAVFSSILLLEHIQQHEAALKLAQAVRQTIEEGILTPDLGGKSETGQVTRRILRHLTST